MTSPYLERRPDYYLADNGAQFVVGVQVDDDRKPVLAFDDRAAAESYLAKLQKGGAP